MADMKYGQIPGLKIPVSRIFQGATQVSSKELEKSYALLDGVFALGCNAFDTAHLYGGGECDRGLGRWMEDRKIRDQVVIMGKCAHHNADRRRVTPADITSDLLDTLARLRSEYVDLWVMHRDDENVPVGPLVEVMNEHLSAGRICAYGGSNWSHTRIQEANEYAASHGLVGFAVSSPNFSLAERVVDPWGNSVCIGGPEGRAAREWYAQTQLAVAPWSSLAAGFFSGRYNRQVLEALGDDEKESCVRWFGNEANMKRLDRCWELAGAKGCSVPQIALAYLFCGPVNVFALAGARSAEEFRENLGALDVTLTPQEIAYLELESDQPGNS